MKFIAKIFKRLTRPKYPYYWSQIEVGDIVEGIGIKGIKPQETRLVKKLSPDHAALWPDPYPPYGYLVSPHKYKYRKPPTQ